MQGLYCVADTLSATYLQQYLQRYNCLSTSILHAFRCRWQMFLYFFRFFVKFGGKFFSAHLANSVSAYIFL